MSNDNTLETKKYISKRIKPLIPVFAKASIGDFSEGLIIPETEDEFTELYTGIQIMLEVIREKISSLEAAKASDEAILADIGEGLIVTDDIGKVTLINPAAEKIIGFNSTDICGELLYEVIQMEDEKSQPIPVRERPVIKALVTGKKTIAEYFYRKKDNSRFPVNVTVTPLVIKKQIVGSIEIFRDITAEKEILRLKDEFISVVSHELKTPLTSMKVFTQMLKNKYIKTGDEKSVLLFSKMETQLNKLTSLVSDLLDVTKMETGKLMFHEEFFDINELINEISEEIQRTTDKHQLINELAASKSIRGNRDRIGQVLTNLLTNAIKYSPASDKIVISTQVKKDNITVCVSDYGVGIPEANLKHLFERYFRVEDNKRSTFPGMGLGLYISSEIIKRHKGNIWVDSEEGRGSTFCFSLPLKVNRRK